VSAVWIDAARLGLAEDAARALACALVLLTAVVSWALARRRPRVAGALAIGWLLALPGEGDQRNAFALLASAPLTAIAVASLARAGLRPPRALRALRVWFFRTQDARFDAVLAGTLVAISVMVSWAAFDLEPVIQDSQAQLFHARIFLRGQLVAPSPPGPAHFLADHVIVEPAFYSQYPPGHTALLALGLLAGAPFLVNPLLGGIALLLLRRVGEAFYDRATGRRAALLALASPFVIGMSSEAMNHASALVLVLVGLLAIARTSTLGPRAAAWSALGGLALGAVLLVRPVTVIALGLPLGALAVHRLRARPALLLPGLATAALGAALLLAFNAATNGDPLRMGYVVRWGPSHSLGFHASPWGTPHTPLRGLDHTLSNLVGASVFLFGGAFPALALVALGTWRERGRLATWALVGMPVCVLALYFFYFYQDLIFGPRYLYEASPALFLLAARGLVALSEEVVATRSPAARRALAWAAPVALVVPLVHFVPAYFHQYQEGYCPRGHVIDRAERTIRGRALVFVDGAYERAFSRVDPWLEARIVYARDLGEANDGLRCAMPDREAWITRGDELARLPAIACP
jgi:hypothetical protein